MRNLAKKDGYMRYSHTYRFDLALRGISLGWHYWSLHECKDHAITYRSTVGDEQGKAVMRDFVEWCYAGTNIEFKRSATGSAQNSVIWFDCPERKPE
jgi:hypothetical protein